MSRMPTLYIRNVPPEVYDALRARAKREGRSVNAEALVILEQMAEGEPRRRTPLVERFRRLAESIDYPADAPRPEEIIRRARDAGSR
jgi:antitoxin FitA